MTPYHESEDDTAPEPTPERARKREAWRDEVRPGGLFKPTGQSPEEVADMVAAGEWRKVTVFCSERTAKRARAVVEKLEGRVPAGVRLHRLHGSYAGGGEKLEFVGLALFVDEIDWGDYQALVKRLVGPRCEVCLSVVRAEPG